MLNLNFKKYLFFSFLCISCYQLTAQKNSINIIAELDTVNNVLKVKQKTVFFNNSSTILNHIYFHNWANSFKNNNTPLAKRFLEDYKKEFHFSKPKNRGYSKIHNLSINNKLVNFKELKGKPDILKVSLKESLFPNDSAIITTDYSVKIPSARFTGYGKTKNGYHLRYWYIIPAVLNGEWNLMSNLNIDDLYQEPTNYTISLQIPKTFLVESNLYQYKTSTQRQNSYYLIGKNKKDIILSISTKNNFHAFKAHKKEVKTDALNKKISKKEITKIIKKQLTFIESFLGKNPHPQIFIDTKTINKNSLQELYGLPRWLKPFPKAYRWEMKFFKALTEKYLGGVLNLNQRKDYWFANGLETFLMMEYTKKHYPNVPILGKYAKYWPIKTYNVAKLKQNDKYAFFYQLSSRRYLDQSLATSADSLSNFNRKVVSKYKAGLGFKYLQGFLGDSILKKSLKEFYYKEGIKTTNSKSFAKILQKNTAKDISWFFGDYLKTTKKIDYIIKKIKLTKNKDSLLVTIKNNRNFTAPVALYGIQKKEIAYKKWITDVDSTKTIKIKNGSYTKLALNYEQTYPEYNLINNFRKVNNSLINKPLQIRFLQDSENPYYNQIFYYPDIKYNLYDGLILGVKISNQPLINRNFDIRITPNYSTKSQNVTGSFYFGYNHFFEESKTIYKINYGISGSNFHYAPELSYNTFYPFLSLQFKRNSLRDVGSKFILGRMIYINKEVADFTKKTDSDSYNVFNIRLIKSEPNVIRRIQYAMNTEFSKKFSKFSTDIRLRKFFDSTRSFDVRFFGGVFLHNNTQGDYFSFGLNRGNDYLFEQNLFGRSENSGIFSQQFVIADGGFKSKFDQSYFANQFIASINTNVSVWKSLGIYNDFAMLKSKKFNPQLFYENGIRLNFIPNIFEFYFPVYTNQGFEITKEKYPSKVRFIISTNLDRIYNFLRRGIL